METELFLWSKNKSICVSRGVSMLIITGTDSISAIIASSNIELFAEMDL